MGAPHNKDRYGELWQQRKIDAYLKELWFIAPDVVLSGGLSWHFLSCVGHIEYKHAHDHRDCDILVPPEKVSSVIMDLGELGFVKIPTKYDKLPNNADFRRYEKFSGGADPFRITIDFFVKTVPFRQIGEWNVIEPSELIQLYGKIHSSDKCWAVVAAQKLLAAGIDPQGRPELTQPPEDSET